MNAILDCGSENQLVYVNNIYDRHLPLYVLSIDLSSNLLII